MIAHFTTHGPQRWPYYVCSTFSKRGRTVCTNGLSLPMVAADHAVLDQFEHVVLDPEIVESAIADALIELQPSADALDTARAALAVDLRRVEEEQRRYAAAIATAGDVPVLAQALQDRERQRLGLLQEIAALDRTRRASPFDVHRVDKDLRAR